jgi:hypothetical protein
VFIRTVFIYQIDSQTYTSQMDKQYNDRIKKDKRTRNVRLNTTQNIKH